MIRPLAVGSLMVRSLLVHPLTLDPLALDADLIDSGAVGSLLLDSRAIGSRLLDLCSLDSRVFDPRLFGLLTFPTLTFNPSAVVAVPLLFSSEGDLLVALALVPPVAGVVHSARRRLISPDDTAVARNVRDRHGTVGWPRLPSWRHAVNPDPAHPSRRALPRGNTIIRMALSHCRNGSP
jgi:hypothetical protein